MSHALTAIWDFIASHWKALGGTISVGAILMLGEKIMGLAKSYYEVIKPKWEAHNAKVKATQSERELLGIDRLTISPQRKLTEEQRSIVIQAIKKQIDNDPPSPHPCWRTVRVVAFPIEDCQAFAYEIASAIKQAGMMVSEHFQGLYSAEDRILYQKGIWVRGHEASDPYFKPPTEILVWESLRKANIPTTLVPTDNPMVELIIGTYNP
jgi:hypothetical protein